MQTCRYKCNAILPSIIWQREFPHDSWQHEPLKGNYKLKQTTMGLSLFPQGLVISVFCGILKGESGTFGEALYWGLSYCNSLRSLEFFRVLMDSERNLPGLWRRHHLEYLFNSANTLSPHPLWQGWKRDHLHIHTVLTLRNHIPPSWHLPSSALRSKPTQGLPTNFSNLIGEVGWKLIAIKFPKEIFWAFMRVIIASTLLLSSIMIRLTNQIQHVFFFQQPLSILRAAPDNLVPGSRRKAFLKGLLVDRLRLYQGRNRVKHWDQTRNQLWDVQELMLCPRLLHLPPPVKSVQSAGYVCSARPEFTS